MDDSEEVLNEAPVEEGYTQVPAQQALAEAVRLKDQGNAHFKEANLQEALNSYAEATRILDVCLMQDKPLRAAIASNEAICCLRLGRPGQAEERASAAIAADPGHSKALYRRGLARLELNDPTGAFDDFKRALLLDPQNREIRKMWEEAKVLAEAVAPAEEEVAVASHAVGAIGGLYVDKHDVNEGRLAETHDEQKEWIKTIANWTEITDIAFADEQDKHCVSVYMTLPNVHRIAPNKVCVWMQANSLEVRVIDLDGKNWCWVAQELWGQIDPSKSSYKIRTDKLSIKLVKREGSRSWDRWEKLRRI